MNSNGKLDIPAQVLWLDAADIANMIGYKSAEAFLRDVAPTPGFPPPSTARDRGRPRWNAQEVHEYMLARRASRAA